MPMRLEYVYDVLVYKWTSNFKNIKRGQDKDPAPVMFQYPMNNLNKSNWIIRTGCYTIRVLCYIIV